ncbi:MAG: molybdopterin-dependent oxidoreductase [Betaproteobacteria bacterium]
MDAAEASAGTVPVSRRQFLQIAAATFGAAGAGCSTRTTPTETGLRTVNTTCDVCFWKCGVVATVRDGKLWKLEGNPLDPLSRGRLCPRGTAGIGMLEDPHRLRTPLIRTGKRGAEQFKAVSWDEALDHIAEKLKKLAAEHGTETIAFFKHGIGAYYVEHAFKAFGTPNVAAPSFAQCRGPRDVGFNLTFGTNPGTPENTDIARAKTLVLIGTHLGENMHNSQVQEFADFLRAGGALIVADPRFSVAASKARFYLPVKPGTDIALLLAWMNVIVREGLHDREYVGEHGHGFDKFAAAIADKTPEQAAPETDIEARLIRETARAMAMTRPATLIHPGRRSTWHGDDAQRGRDVALLNALMGNWGREGGFYMPSCIGLEDYPGTPKYPKSARGKADNKNEAGNKRWPFADQTVSTGLREATVTGVPYPIKAWVVDATNLLQAIAGRARTLEAINTLDFLLVIDTVPSEIAGYADVVLPEAMYLERHDTLNDDCLRMSFLALRQPVLDPPHEQKPGWWIGKELGRRLGLEAFFPWNDLEECLKVRVTNGGFDWMELKTKGILIGPQAPLYVDQGAEVSYDTPSGKVEFWSQQLADKGFDPVPRYTPPAAGPEGAYRLITGRAPMHTFSRTVGNPRLAQLMPENTMWVNAGEARRLGVANGQRVRLRNQDGVVSDPVAVQVTERIRPECVYMVHRFGSESRAWKGAYRKGASTAQLTTRVKVDPLMGSTSIHGNFVTLLPAMGGTGAGLPQQAAGQRSTERARG